MMSSENNLGKQFSIYSLGLGLLYLVFGSLELVRGLIDAFSFKWVLSEISPIIVYPDIFSGITLSIIGIIFLFGVKSQWIAEKQAVSYLVVGTLLSAVFFCVYLVIMGAHAIGWGVYHVIPESYVEIFSDWANWVWTDDLRPGIWLFIFTLPGAYYTFKMWLLRKKLQ